PVLGTLINFLAMKRVNTRGIKQANKCMLMAAIAYNIKKMMKFNTRKPVAKVVSIAKGYEKTMIDLYLTVIFQFIKSKSEISAC
ncbi:MAG: IS1182 family transposase, partial [Cyclobacteriaceae bacterium]|nr:IS1182 family transposase [Cyclobacteriaceae bacterium]